ncbi:Rieske (2Fe-2S) protein [Haloechinothrix sp. YIM 98757]|uniref:Rieske-type oxygenase n=1 Tax=Haloechinothrix aidingensis TaxID=2752311 RepID=A0A838AC03_9PSEU|nr:Rieske 2Fe-2S domain-containing protein [Haloechinothrix aidingensis]MBA0126792.1 Rieske (2Fe-2S) protein [Haloechinothrix aidingensis]
MYNFPHKYFASSWYQVGWSAEFPRGTVVPLRYFNKDFVAYRGESGDMHISDAFCRHFGAHLGYGGTVEGDCIICPFHGWKWAADGQNVEIPYSQPDQMNLTLGTWTVREVDGLVLMWYGADGEGPTSDPPHFLPTSASLEDDFWEIYPDTTEVWKGVRFPPQVVQENAADSAHFKYVHGAGQVPEILGYDWDEHSFRTRFSFRFGDGFDSTWATPNGPVDGRITTTAYGLGLAGGHVESFDTAYTLAATTPIDYETSDHRCTVWVPRVRGDGSPLDEKIRDRWARQQITQHAADVPVWENMTYVHKPPFAQAEATALRNLRKWIEKHYPADAGDGAKPPADSVVN